MGKGLKVLLAAVAVALTVTAVTLAATTRTGATSDTLVFGTASEPTSLDGAVVSDGESLRVIDQITEGLVGLKNGTTVIVPKLATSWKASNGGKVVDVQAPQGRQVPGRDAVQREGGLRELQPVVQLHRRVQPPTRPRTTTTRSSAATRSRGRRAHQHAAVPQLQGGRRLDRGHHPAAAELGVPRRAVADRVRDAEPDRDGEVRRQQGHAVEGRRVHPRRPVRRPGGFAVGTGPFKLESWKIGDKLVLVRNDSYWGKKAILRRVIFRRSPTTPRASRRCRTVRSRATTSSSRRTSRRSRGTRA